MPIHPDKKVATNLSSLKYTDCSSGHLISLDTLKIDSNFRITLTKKIRELLRVESGDTMAFFVDTYNDNLICRIQRNGSNKSVDSWILSRSLDESISSFPSDSSVVIRNDQQSQSYAIDEMDFKGSDIKQKPKQKDKINLMIVEDQNDVIFFIENVLLAQGYNLESFQSSIDVLAKLSERMDPIYFDLVIIDIRMPVLNGLQLYQLLKLTNKNLKAIFISALDGVEEMISILPGLNNNNFLKKPFDSESLVQKVKSVIDQQ